MNILQNLLSFKSNNLNGELIPVHSWPLVVINDTAPESWQAKQTTAVTK